jgi:hypothetical protein
MIHACLICNLRSYCTVLLSGVGFQRGGHEAASVGCSFYFIMGRVDGVEVLALDVVWRGVVAQ